MNRLPLQFIELNRNKFLGKQLCVLEQHPRIASTFCFDKRPRLSTFGEHPGCELYDQGKSLKMAAVNSAFPRRLIGGFAIQNGNLAYLVNPRYWRRGYGFEIAEMACHLATVEMKLDRLYAAVLRSNRVSTQILEKLGFRFVGLESFSGDRGCQYVLQFERHSTQAYPD